MTYESYILDLKHCVGEVLLYDNITKYVQSILLQHAMAEGLTLVIYFALGMH